MFEGEIYLNVCPKAMHTEVSTNSRSLASMENSNWITHKLFERYSPNCSQELLNSAVPLEWEQQEPLLSDYRRYLFTGLVCSHCCNQGSLSLLLTPQLDHKTLKIFERAQPLCQMKVILGKERKDTGENGVSLVHRSPCWVEAVCGPAAVEGPTSTKNST